MTNLLHIDSSITGEHSTSRRLTARAAAAWRAAHPEGTVTYRDLGADPLPHLGAAANTAKFVPPEQHTPAQGEAWRLITDLVDEVRSADTILLGLPLYNFGAPSTVKAWVDHLIVPGLTLDAETREGLLGDRDFIVVVSRGGGYGEGTPREGWDHAQSWIPHGVSLTGLAPRFVTAELTMAKTNPAMADLIPLAEASQAEAERVIDALWAPVAA
ncbi:FMN-dependent NADH-azoreductase [Amycolatopsis sp. WAC 01375]|uniref:FMN-dependent NADH-azoreductase n=1 Tax=unclassified Amycolatopsis TaxID=2618356 RepID=UPI000F772463|nr:MULTISPECIES: NAD(P)H-dependent oxidoreductase [unclassified Amycolatopsis]RSM80845.1 FMN-dependent NADH-azoreductase [Amycolatopsis sp. WAC 01375]RSN29619.1 FMN-dependent NADH-azoreductase [Amycolatopsis sp. WAC 01416]